jgi:hypothetical protein
MHFGNQQLKLKVLLFGWFKAVMRPYPWEALGVCGLNFCTVSTGVLLAALSWPHLSLSTNIPTSFKVHIYVFHPFDTNVYRIHPSFLILSFYISNLLVQCIHSIKIYIASIIHIQYKNIQLLSAIKDQWQRSLIKGSL